jgi:hypothetical protein
MIYIDCCSAMKNLEEKPGRRYLEAVNTREIQVKLALSSTLCRHMRGILTWT